MVIRARCDIRAENADYEMNSLRKAAYRQLSVYTMELGISFLVLV